MRTRIAPTPSGLLHIGNAVNFLVTWAFARARSGEVLLRIDDADPQMVVLGSMDDIYETIEWLGVDLDGVLPSQQGRYYRYDEVLQELRKQGRLFACTCTRSEIRAQSASGEYPGTCLNKGLDLDAPDVAWRFAMDGALPYPTLRGKNGLPGYHIATLCDDVDFGITTVVRGQDLAPSTDVQRTIASLCTSVEGFSKVDVFHHGLVTDPHGAKLSKSHGASSVAALRSQGISPNIVAEMAATLDLPSDVRSIIQARVNGM